VSSLLHPVPCTLMVSSLLHPVPCTLVMSSLLHLLYTCPLQPGWRTMRP